MSMTVRDLFNNWEGIAALVIRNGSTVLMLNRSAVPPNEAWFLRIVRASAEERKAIEEAGYVLKDA
jgi:hypothetical protein